MFLSLPEHPETCPALGSPKALLAFVSEQLETSLRDQPLHENI